MYIPGRLAKIKEKPSLSTHPVPERWNTTNVSTSSKHFGEVVAFLNQIWVTQDKLDGAVYVLLGNADLLRKLPKCFEAVGNSHGFPLRYFILDQTAPLT